MGIEASSGRGAADSEFFRLVGSSFQPDFRLSNRSRVGGEFLSEPDWNGVLEVGSRRFKNMVELLSFCLEGFRERVDRLQEVREHKSRHDPHGAGEGVIR